MPGVFFHLCEATFIKDYILNNPDCCSFTRAPGWTVDFTIGNALPDASDRKYKYQTHFWHPDDWSHVVIAPDIDRFLAAYPNPYCHPMLLGYLAHLHLDHLYFTEYLPQYARFINAQGQEEQELTKVIAVLLVQTGERIPLKQFFSQDYFYGDYIRINPYLISKYHPDFPDTPPGSWPIRETDLPAYRKFCKIAALELKSEQRFRPMKIFDCSDFEEFLHRAADIFIRTYLVHSR